VVDVDITRGGATFLLANPFKLGPRGSDESLRAMACALYREWLAARTIRAGNFPSALPVARHLLDTTGDAVTAEVGRLVRLHGRTSLFNLVCGRRCSGRLCHGQELARLFQQVIDSVADPPFPKELKWTVGEIMNDLAILMHLSALTGLPLFQLVTDVKDFFNQHGLAHCEKPKVGLATLDPRAIVAHAEGLRATEPGLCAVAEHVLGYGLFPASNVCQRHAYFLIFIWMVWWRCWRHLRPSSRL
jgi:hypothetical protein